MFDTTLIDRLTVLANKEKKIKEYKRRLRIRGRVTEKGTTKRGNITLKIRRGDDEYKFTILKNHKERFALAEKITTGRSISLEGISKLRMIICTKLKILEKGIPEGKQTKLNIEKIER